MPADSANPHTNRAVKGAIHTSMCADVQHMAGTCTPGRQTAPLGKESAVLSLAEPPQVAGKVRGPTQGSSAPTGARCCAAEQEPQSAQRPQYPTQAQQWSALGPPTPAASGPCM